MDAWRDALSKVLESGFDELLDTLEVMSKLTPGQTPMPRAEAQQALSGFIKLIQEGLRGGPPSIRSFYLETVVPGSIKTGSSAQQVTEGSVEFCMLMVGFVAQKIEASCRQPALAWLAKFLSGFLVELGHIARESEAHGKSNGR